MVASDTIIQKIMNGLKFVNARPHLFIPPNIRNTLNSVVAKASISPEEARDVLEWYASKPTDIPPEILDQLTGKEPGRAWFKALAKKAPPKQPVPKNLAKDLEKKIDEALNKKPLKEIHHVSTQVVGAGANGNNGWTPVIALEPYNGGVYQKVVEWFGGQGPKPEINVYIGEDGFVNNIEDAVNIRGPAGTGGGGDFEGVPLFIQDGAPVTDFEKYMWIQTNYITPDGFTFWFEDGT